jgi:hypothetical protein
MRRRTPEPRRPGKRGPAPLCRPSYQGTRLRRLAIRGTRSPPWSVDEADPKLHRRCFIVRDANGQALAYVSCEEEPGPTRRGQVAHPRRGRAGSPPTLPSCPTYSERAPDAGTAALA